MKSILLLTLIAAAGCAKQPAQSDAGDAAAKAEGPSSLTRNTNGEPVLTLDTAAQERMGLKTVPVAARQLAPERRGFGRVLDPAQLSAAAAELVAARANATASAREAARLTALFAQANASARSLETAQAVAGRDAAQAESAQVRFVAAWGKAIADRADLSKFVEALATGESALVRIDLPAGEWLQSPPARARLVPLSDEPGALEAEVLGPAPAVDPQTQGRGFLVMVNPNSSRLAPGEALTGYLPLAGEPQNGAVVPRAAIIRHQGAAWVYLETGGTHFTRRAVSLDRPLADGWFVSSGVAGGDRVVVTGAQAIFSQELSSSGFMSGSRD